MTELTAGKKRFVLRHLRNTDATVRVGKSGVSPELLEEIEKRLKKSKMVKVKMLRTALFEHGTKSVAEKIARQTCSSLVEVRGHTFILYKPRAK